MTYRVFEAGEEGPIDQREHSTLREAIAAFSAARKAGKLDASTVYEIGDENGHVARRLSGATGKRAAE